MKILMPVLHYYPVIGGLETWTQNIAERLADKAEIFVVTGKVKSQPNEEIKNGVKIFRTSLFFLKDLSYSSPVYLLTALPFIFFKSLELIGKEKINILHCQGFLSSLIGYLLLKLSGIPYLVTVQRLEDKNWLKKIVYRNAACCIAASSAIKKYFEEIGSKNIEIIPNGINVSRFQNLNREESRMKLGLKDEFVIMTVARLEKRKGIQHLIEAVKNNQLSGNYQLLIIGDGDERKNLENLAQTLNLKDKVKFLGPIPNEKIPGYLAAADCFILPSLKEGFGISILEAMAAGVPVIATRVGGILDIIKDGKNGILVEPQNSNEISDAVLKIHSQPEFKQKLVNSARAELTSFEWGNIADKVYKIYQEILS